MKNLEYKIMKLWAHFQENTQILTSFLCLQNLPKISIMISDSLSEKETCFSYVFQIEAIYEDSFVSFSTYCALQYLTL